MLSTEFPPRLSVWQRVGADWQCVAYAEPQSGGRGGAG